MRASRRAQRAEIDTLTRVLEHEPVRSYGLYVDTGQTQMILAQAAGASALLGHPSDSSFVARRL